MFNVDGKTVKRYTALVPDNNGIKTYKCKPCNSTLQEQKKCIACGTYHPYYRTIKFRFNKYDMNDDTVKMTLNFPLINYDSICKECDYKLTATNTCTCCHSKLHIYKVIEFYPHNYDFTNYIVSWTLSSQNRTVHDEKEYICKTCHNNLITKDNHLPYMPRKVIAHKKSVPGYKFLQAICEKPEFMCTCCHKWVFHRSVLKYDETKYNMLNDTVKETLHERYHHPMQVTMIQGICSAHEHPIDYDYDDCYESESDEENDHDNFPSTSIANTGAHQTIL